MPRWIKRLLTVIALLLALGAGGGSLAVWWALRQFTPERVVHHLESVYNARVQLDGCTLSLFSSPARLELVGLHFHPRDGEADRASPPASRPPIKITNTYLRMRSGTVEADLAALILRREINVKAFHIEMGDVKCDILPGGGNSLSHLFRAPATVGGRPNPAVAAIIPVAAAIAVAAEAATPDATPSEAGASEQSDPPADPDAGESTESPMPDFYARDLHGPIAIDRVTFTDGRARIRNRKTRAVTELNQLNLIVSGLSVDPARLTDANRASVDLRSRLWVDGGRKNPGRLAELEIALQGTLAPFEASTSRLQPDMEATAVISRGATLRSLPALEKIEKNLARARRAGLRLDPLSTEAVLAADTPLAFRFTGHRLSLTAPATLDFTGYALLVEAGSELDLNDDSHKVSAAWMASQAISDKALGGANSFLESLGTNTGAELRRLLIDPLVKGGRLHMAFTSSGALAKPDVHIAHPLQDVTDQLKDAGRGLLDRLRDQ
ncbi:MAG: hypothetical protein ACKV19_20805 [Verrucomicrobiales bacterium]